nr:hypothetical protein GCM10020093_026390 [Planobispora longispora]
MVSGSTCWCGAPGPDRASWPLLISASVMTPRATARRRQNRRVGAARAAVRATRSAARAARPKESGTGTHATIGGARGRAKLRANHAVENTASTARTAVTGSVKVRIRAAYDSMARPR